MEVKHSPCKFNEYANIQANSNTQINYVDENTIRIDGELYEFDKESVQFPDIYTQTDGVILEAHRTDNELFITVRRFYTDDCTSWDNGEFNDIKG